MSFAEDLENTIGGFEKHTNILSGAELLPENELGIYSIFSTAISWNIGSQSFGDSTDKLNKIFGSLFNGNTLMDAAKSAIESIATKIESIGFMDKILNGTDTAKQIIGSLGQVDSFADQTAAINELIYLAN